MPESTCRSCQAAVLWAVTHNGKRMPVDAEPVEGGNIKLRREGDKVIAEFPGKEHPALFEDNNRARYVSHFSTCPESTEWRKR